jgi:hypothetical protein
MADSFEIAFTRGSIVSIAIVANDARDSKSGSWSQLRNNADGRWQRTSIVTHDELYF